MHRPKQMTAAWLALLWMVNVGLFLVLLYASVRTISGQMLDTVALYGNSLGRRTVDGPLDVALNAVSAVSLVLGPLMLVACMTLPRLSRPAPSPL